MKLIVKQLAGEVAIDFFGKCGYRMHTETLIGKISGDSVYERNLDLNIDDVYSTKSRSVSVGSFVEYGIAD